MALSDADKVEIAQLVGDILAKALPPARRERASREVKVELALDPELKELFNAGMPELAVSCQALRVLREIRDRGGPTTPAAVVPTVG